MAERAKWKDILKNEVEKSPLMSNLLFGLILIVLEKLVELEFSCPCISGRNALFASVFFIIPGTLSFVLMMRIRGYKWEKNVWQCCIPPIVWLTLIFLDGQYFACAMTGWSGSYETAPQSSHLKWCKPDNTSHKTSEELLRKTQHWFSISQVIGMVFVFILTVVTGVYPKNEESFERNNQGVPVSSVGTAIAPSTNSAAAAQDSNPTSAPLLVVPDLSSLNPITSSAVAKLRKRIT